MPLSLTRLGDKAGALQVWEQARSLAPNHAETLLNARLVSATHKMITGTVSVARNLLESRPTFLICRYFSRTAPSVAHAQNRSTKPVTSHTVNRPF